MCFCFVIFACFTFHFSSSVLFEIVKNIGVLKCHNSKSATQFTYTHTYTWMKIPIFYQKFIELSNRTKISPPSFNSAQWVRLMGHICIFKFYIHDRYGNDFHFFCGGLRKAKMKIVGTCCTSIRISVFHAA